MTLIQRQVRRLAFPLPEAWARRGSTELKLAGIPDDLLADLLRSAWRKVAPKSLLKDQGPSA